MKELSTARCDRGILLLELDSAPALVHDLRTALPADWPVTVLNAIPRQASLLPPVAAAFLVTEQIPAADRIATWVPELRRREPDLPLVVAAGAGAPQDFASLLEQGVADFVLHPFRRSDVQGRLLHLISRQRLDPLVERLKAKLGMRRLVGQSEAFVAAVERIAPLAACDANVLIMGETGTGKEVFARAIHHLGRRSGFPFAPVNCGAIPTELVENELFGHAAEAFTSAAHSRSGLIREAEGGTLFLDEIDALPAAAQVKLLRFLQEKEYRALGSTEVRHADVRLIAATNARVDDEIESGRLRRDLYYRLNVLPLVLPPLRERGEDVLALAQHFLARHAAELGRPVPRLTDSGRQALLEHDWPGNARELEHAMERAVLLAGSGRVGPAEMQLRGSVAEQRPLGPFKQAKDEAVAGFERRYVERLLLAWSGNISRAAQAAGKNRRAFFELIRKHRIDVRRFRERS